MRHWLGFVVQFSFCSCAREYSLFLCAREDICLCASAFCIFARVFNGGSSFTLMKTILYGRNIGQHCVAPSYANLFMDDLERKIISASTLKPYMWLRFIDDVFMIWTHGEERLREFLDFINGFHNSIKFTWEWSQKKVNFLDIQIINNGGQVDTDLYVKPTDKHQYLTYNSCHPRGCKTSIPYAQAMRLKRICSTQEAFERRAEELTEFLVHRGYQRNMVREQ